MDYEAFFRQKLEDIKAEGRYRIFADLERCAKDFPYAFYYNEGNPRRVVVWCANDYLAMGQNEKVLDAMSTAITRVGAGAIYRQPKGDRNRMQGLNFSLVNIKKIIPTYNIMDFIAYFTLQKGAFL